MSNNPPGTASVSVPAGYGNLKLKWFHQGSNELAICNMGVGPRFADGIDPANLIDDGQDLVDAFAEEWQTQMQPILYPGWTWMGAELYVWENDQEAAGLIQIPRFFDAPRALAGPGSQSPMPPQICLIVKKLTGQGGRANRGRMYLPAGFLGDNEVDAGGVIDADKVIYFRNHLNTVFGSMSALGWTQYVLHGRRKGPSEGSFTAAGAPSLVTSLQVQPKIGTQRRRLSR